MLDEAVEAEEYGESLVVVALVILQVAVIVDEVDFHVGIQSVKLFHCLRIILFREVVVFQHAIDLSESHVERAVLFIG